MTCRPALGKGPNVSSNKFCKAARFERDLAQLDKVHVRINTPGKSRDKPEQVASLIQLATHGTHGSEQGVQYLLGLYIAKSTARWRVMH